MQYTTISNENTVNNNKKVYFELLYIGTFSNATKIISPLKIGSFLVVKTPSYKVFNVKSSILRCLWKDTNTKIIFY